ncbi:hypothetical protein KC354_g36 [Hortaea werneckii]|nr:hypothetical protein KC354_g36 [Hortaea werneckii]
MVVVLSRSTVSIRLVCELRNVTDVSADAFISSKAHAAVNLEVLVVVIRALHGRERDATDGFARGHYVSCGRNTDLEARIL